MVIVIQDEIKFIKITMNQTMISKFYNQIHQFTVDGGRIFDLAYLAPEKLNQM